MIHEGSRYYIYEMKKKFVSCDIPSRFGSGRISGIVTDVYRDVIDHKLKITVGKQIYIFREPTSIRKTKNKIILIYGEEFGSHVGDEELFKEMQDIGNKGGNIDDAIRSLEKDSIIFVEFEMKMERKK